MYLSLADLVPAGGILSQVTLFFFLNERSFAIESMDRVLSLHFFFFVNPNGYNFNLVH